MVRLRGVCSAQANDQRQLQSIQLWLADTSAIQIVEPAPAANFERPLHAIASLGRYGSIQTYEHRIKVRHFLAVLVQDFRPLHKSNVA